MKRLVSIVLPILLITALGIWWFSPTQVVKRRTKSFLDVLTLEATSGKPARQMKVFTFNGMLEETVTLKNPSQEELNGSLERSEIENGFSWLINNASSSRFDVVEFQSIQVSDETAQVDFTVDALVELPTYRPADGKYDVGLTWKKGKDGWRLSSAVWSEQK